MQRLSERPEQALRLYYNPLAGALRPVAGAGSRYLHMYVYSGCCARRIPPVAPSLSSLLPPSRVAVAGTVAIELHVTSPTRIVVLHAHQLTIGDVTTFSSSDGTTVKAVSALFDFSAQTVTFAFSGELPVGLGVLSTAFHGTLNDELAGFYRSRYSVRGKQRTMALTQFEATDARRCFPCVDEVSRATKREGEVRAPRCPTPPLVARSPRPRPSSR